MLMLDQTDRLILYIVCNLTTGARDLLLEGDGVMTTMLAKLLFLVDVWAMQSFGSQATDFSYIRYKFGPYPLAQFDERLEGLKEWGLSRTEKETIEDGRRYRIYRCRLKTEVELPSNIKLLADEVMTTFATQRLDDVLAHVYSLDFVRKAAFGAPIELESLKPRQDALTRVLSLFKDGLSEPVSKEHNEAVEQAQGETSNENIEMARGMREKQQKAFRLKQAP